MPSSFSTDLRIELIQTGEQSGTWGTTTNTNLGTIIEDAISGMAAITTIISPYTLTTVNGAADQARCAALQLATTTGANFIVVVPTVTKLYVVKNVDTTYSVTVKTASGSGVVVPVGRTALLRCDGVNVVEQLDYIAGGLTLGTSLGVSSGGTGRATLTANNVVLGNGASAVNFVAPGVAGSVLQSDGTTWTSAAAPGLPSGTRLLFQQTAAPTGWTKVTTFNDVALRVVSGAASSGGSVAFSTAFVNQSVGGSVGNTTLTTSQMPSHTHDSQWWRVGTAKNNTGTRQTGPQNTLSLSEVVLNQTINNTGDSGSHSHGFTGTAINLAVQYVDVIIASKD
jgi:hypothetical protein